VQTEKNVKKGQKKNLRRHSEILEGLSKPIIPGRGERGRQSKGKTSTLSPWGGKKVLLAKKMEGIRLMSPSS